MTSRNSMPAPGLMFTTESLPGSIGLARPKENGIPFMFKDDKGNTTLSPDVLYDPKNESWQRIMDAR